jgi:hypothetical protein
MKRFMFASIGVLCLALSVLIGYHVGSRAALAQSETITARKFILVDSMGRRVGEWSHDGEKTKFQNFAKNTNINAALVTDEFGACLTLDARPSQVILLSCPTRSSMHLACCRDSLVGTVSASADRKQSLIQLESPSRATMVFREKRPYPQLTRNRVVIGNTHEGMLPFGRDNRPMFSRPMASIVVVSDSATVKIP